MAVLSVIECLEGIGYRMFDAGEEWLTGWWCA